MMDEGNKAPVAEASNPPALTVATPVMEPAAAEANADMLDLLQPDPAFMKPLWRAVKNPQTNANDFLRIEGTNCFLRYPQFLQAAWPEGQDLEVGRKVMIDSNIIYPADPDEEGWIRVRRGAADVLIPLATYVGLGPSDRSKPNTLEEEILYLFAAKGARVLTLTSAEFNLMASKRNMKPGVYAGELSHSEYFVRRSLKDGHQLELVKNHEG
jgi:hypothetical protein